MEYNFSAHKTGTTFPGVPFQILVNGAALILTSATIKMSLKLKKTAETSVKDFSTTSGELEITDAASGKFRFKEQIIDVAAATYFYDILITLSDGRKKAYIEGSWQIEPKVTNG